jgi:hypothetical protein
MKNSIPRAFALIAWLAFFPANLLFAVPELYNLPEPTSTPLEQDVSISSSFAPFGQRPESDKTGDDGSVALRDRNGVIIWSTTTGKPLVLPNSGLAKTLYVSNSECIVYNNRFANDYNLWNTSSQVIIYRRQANSDGTDRIVASPTISIEGTLVDTAPITPTSYGYTLVSAVGWNVSTSESTETVRSGSAGTPPTPTYTTNKIDQWHNINYNMHRLTFDGNVQTLDFVTIDVPQTNTNLGATRVVGTGDDGSLVISSVQARNFAISQVPDSPLGTQFVSGYGNIWASWQFNAESIVSFFPPPFDANDPYFPGVSDVAYVSNSRLIMQDADEEDELNDFRMRNTGVAEYVDTQTLTPGDEILAVTGSSQSGQPPFIYTIDAATRSNVSLYRYDATLTKVGATVALPSPIRTIGDYVRNPADGSLLIKAEGASGVLWIPATATGGLLTPISLPNSSLAKPMFVSSTEAIAWMNASAAAVGGQVPIAKIIHFSGASGSVATTITADSPSDGITSPILGRYVAIPPQLTPDPENGGWFITTFEKTASLDATMRVYRLRTASTLDSDGDGLLDTEELVYNTDSRNPDTDGDGITDGQEIYPFYRLTGSFNYEQARLDAIRRGGFLAVLDTLTKQGALKRILGSLPLGSKLWLGGGDFDDTKIPPTNFEGQYRWMDSSGRFFDADKNPVGSSINSFNWAPSQPTNVGNADGLVLRRDYQWEMGVATRSYGYVLEFIPSDPNSADSDGDGLTDGDEFLRGTDPNSVNPFTSGPGFTTDVNGSGSAFVPFNDLGVATSYEGLVFDPAQGHVFHQKLTVSKSGAFSTSLRGLTPTLISSFKGLFRPAGNYLGVGPKGMSNVVSLEMQMFMEAPGQWIVLGRATTTAGNLLSIELRPVKYSKTNPYPLPGRVTMAMPSTSALLDGGPRGDAAAVGTISSSGQLALSLYLPEGGKASFSGAILSGDYAALYAVSSSRNRSVMIGPVDMAYNTSDRDFGGFARFYSGSAPAGSAYALGFNQLRSVLGCRYLAPTVGSLPVSGFASTQFNSRLNLEGGDFGGISKISTWSVANKITVPVSPLDSGIASFASATGLLSYSYTLTDTNRGLIKAKAKATAVTLQKTSKIRGHYTTGLSDGGFTVTPNDGSVPELTVISPFSKKAPVEGITYDISVQTSGLWELVVPIASTWFTAEIVRGGVYEEAPAVDPVPGTVGSVVLPDGSTVYVPGVTPDPSRVASKVIGFGNGTVRVTVTPNATYRRREVSLQVAGFSHKLWQDNN